MRFQSFMARVTDGHQDSCFENLFMRFITQEGSNFYINLIVNYIVSKTRIKIVRMNNIRCQVVFVCTELVLSERHVPSGYQL